MLVLFAQTMPVVRLSSCFSFCSNHAGCPVVRLLFVLLRPCRLSGYPVVFPFSTLFSNADVGDEKVIPIVSPIVGPFVIPIVCPIMSPNASPVVSPIVGPIVNPIVSPLVNPFVSPFVHPFVNLL